MEPVIGRVQHELTDCGQSRHSLFGLCWRGIGLQLQNPFVYGTAYFVEAVGGDVATNERR